MSRRIGKVSNFRFTKSLGWAMIFAISSLGNRQMAFAQFGSEFHRTLLVTATEQVTLDVELPRGDLQILYSREGQVSITGFAQDLAGARLGQGFFKAVLIVEQDGNHLRLRHATSPTYPVEGIRVLYRIDVPYRTEVNARVDDGRLTFSGIMGPIKAVTGKGDIKASYVSKGLQAQVDTGNVDLEVIGERAAINTGRGNISCVRALQGVSAETGGGDIALMVVGPTKAIVKNGTGRIDAGGVRGTFFASTNTGDLHVKAVPHDAWQLNSASGEIRVDLPPRVRFEVDATTASGAFQTDRDDIATPPSPARSLHQKVNGGGTRIDVHTVSGNIVFR
jgi:hypothetical protein